MRLPSLIVLLLSAIVIAGCATKGGDNTTAAAGSGKATASKPAAPVNPFSEGNTLYTLTNLHPDPAQYRLYSSNFLLTGFIPRCTAVQVNDISKKRFVFTAKGVKYSYELNPRSTPEGLEENLKLFFGKSCDNGAVSRLSATDQKGIRDGKPLVGMSKQGVIYAIGYPPSATTPDTKATVWVYFKNRFNKMNVEFNAAGIVTKVVD